jgi:hypothetical protein
MNALKVPICFSLLSCLLNVRCVRLRKQFVKVVLTLALNLVIGGKTMKLTTSWNAMFPSHACKIQFTYSYSGMREPDNNPVGDCDEG